MLCIDLLVKQRESSSLVPLGMSVLDDEREQQITQARRLVVQGSAQGKLYTPCSADDDGRWATFT